MSSIIAAIESGSLAKKGIAINFDQPFYLVEFADERVGVYVRSPGLKLYTYSELMIINGAVKQTVPTTSPFFGVEGLNDFFQTLLDNNHTLSVNTKDGSVSPNFVVNTYKNNPKTKQLEVLDLQTFALSKNDKDKYTVSSAYLTSKSNTLKINKLQKALIAKLRSFITNLFNVQKTSGSLTIDAYNQINLNVLDPLRQEKSILHDFWELSQTGIASNERTLDINGLVAQAIEGTDLKLAKSVGLNDSPYLYLVPETETA